MVASRELGLQGVSARPLAILPILPGSIATGSRSGHRPPLDTLIHSLRPMIISARSRVRAQQRDQRRERERNNSRRLMADETREPSARAVG